MLRAPSRLSPQREAEAGRAGRERGGHGVQGTSLAESRGRLHCDVVFRRFANVFRPASFQGHGRAAPYFEGWYIKLVDEKQRRPLALIPGVYRGTDRTRSHGFLQVFDGARDRAWYCRYPVDEFWAHARDFDVRVGPNRFTVREGEGAIELDVDEPGLRLHGAVTLHGVGGWPVRPWSPGVMGPFGLLPFLECYHGVVGLDHGLRGELHLNEGSLSFEGGRGYLEKDWGTNFPRSWIWCQCNHFAAPGQTARRVSLTASIAEVPNLGRTFPGFIVGLSVDGTLHRFTTHDLAWIDVLRADDDQVRWVLSNRSHRLAITAHRAPTTRLPGPSIEGMEREVYETLRARVEVRLTTRPRGDVVYEGQGSCAGLEVQGDIRRLARFARSR